MEDREAHRAHVPDGVGRMSLAARVAGAAGLATDPENGVAGRSPVLVAALLVASIVVAVVTLAVHAAVLPRVGRGGPGLGGGVRPGLGGLGRRLRRRAGRDAGHRSSGSPSARGPARLMVVSLRSAPVVRAAGPRLGVPGRRRLAAGRRRAAARLAGADLAGTVPVGLTGQAGAVARAGLRPPSVP
jgi:hypothetical protein